MRTNIFETFKSFQSVELTEEEGKGKEVCGKP